MFILKINYNQAAPTNTIKINNTKTNAYPLPPLFLLLLQVGSAFLLQLQFKSIISPHYMICKELKLVKKRKLQLKKDIAIII